MTIVYLTSFIASLLLSLLLTGWVRNLALRRGWVAAPSSHHIHQRAIPRLGGVAIFASFVAVTATLMVLSHFRHESLGVQTREFLQILAPGALIFLLGLYD